jgi:hypothetical protein
VLYGSATLGRGSEFLRDAVAAFSRAGFATAELEVEAAPRIIGGGPDPWHRHLLAWEYLLPGRRMTRRVDTLEVHSPRWGMKKMELDVSFPTSCLTGNSDPDDPPERCLIPAAFIPKDPVAVDLEVRNSDGAWVSVPTRRECRLLTEQAIELIGHHAAGLLQRSVADFELGDELRRRVGDVITMEPLKARVSRLHIERKMGLSGEVGEWLLPLLRRLEDNYLLWTPIEGSPLGDHHLSIRRSDRREGERFFWPLRLFKKDVTVDSQAGTIHGNWRPPSKWIFVPSTSAIFARLLLSFGLMPIKFEEETLEAHRFASYHLAMVPPTGLVVREVRSGEICESEWGEENPAVEEIKTDIDRTVHGEDTRTGHVHLEMDRNPSWLNSRITIGLRPGTTTLWAMVVVLTCGLLWVLRHELERILGSTEDIDTQVTAAVLLVGPTFAASWSLRNNPTLIRSMVGGAEGLLLSSAVVSVAAALVLAGFKPFDWGPEKTIDWYASVSFAIAVLIVTGWLQARSLVWLVYRYVLSNTTMNLLATAIFSAIALVTVRDLEDVPVAPAAVLLLVGFALTAVAGNRTSVGLGQNSRLAAFWAGLAALVCLALAGRMLEFFNHTLSEADALHFGEIALMVFGGAAMIAFLLNGGREIVQYSRNKRSSGSASTMEIAGKIVEPQNSSA